jgi:hypothetical protein
MHHQSWIRLGAAVALVAAGAATLPAAGPKSSAAKSSAAKSAAAKAATKQGAANNPLRGGVAPANAAPAKAAAQTGALSAQKLPAWTTVAAATDGYLAKLPEYRAGDILSRSQVQALLAQLAKAGWTVSDGNQILASVSDDNDFVVKQLRTKEGRKFMRKIAGTTQAYDRLQRLAATDGGDRAVRDMMKLPNGDEVLAALTESKAGRDISRRLADGPKTGGFDQPTGRIYTQAQLVDRLKQSHDRDAAKSAAKPR